MDRDLVLLFNLGEEIYNYCTAPIEQCSNLASAHEGGNTLAYNPEKKFTMIVFTNSNLGDEFARALEVFLWGLE